MSFDKELPPPPYTESPVYPLPMTPDISYINDYLSWSIVNVFLGWGFLGIIPLVFSIVCRNNKSINNLNGAETMSSLAFIFNILITIGGLIGWVVFTVFMYINIYAIHNLT